MIEEAEPVQADVRRAVRALPRERRRALAGAIREGRAVEDPRDLALAAAWARRLQQVYWPGWALPRTRPHGWRAWLWLAHLAWIVAAVALAVVSVWSGIPGVWRWVLVGVMVYALVGVPLTLAPIFRSFWNAPQAERRNRELLLRESPRHE